MTVEQNPWLTIPLEDYEGHMALPEVGQAKMLASEFKALLETFHPAAVAVLGCAGGNGFEAAGQAGVTRLVGLDISPAYITETQRRYADHVPGLELYCADIQGDLPVLEPVQMIFAALVFEYVRLADALRNVRKLCLPGGLFAALLQLPKAGLAIISPTPFTAINRLAPLLRLVPPADLREAADRQGFNFISEKVITLESGKQFSLLLFRS